LDIEESRQGEIVVLVPEGSLNSAPACGALDQKLGALLEAKDRLLVVDCHKVGQLSAAAVRTLLTCKRKLAPVGGRLVLCALSEKVRKVFRVSGFDQDFLIVASRAEAVRKAAEAPPAPQPRPAAPPAPVAAAPPRPPEKSPAELRVERLAGLAMRLLAGGRDAATLGDTGGGRQSGPGLAERVVSALGRLEPVGTGR
jgi:anti-anti-sigma factor